MSKPHSQVQNYPPLVDYFTRRSDRPSWQGAGSPRPAARVHYSGPKSRWLCEDRDKRAMVKAFRQERPEEQGHGPARRLGQRTGRVLLWMQAQHRERALARFQTWRLGRRLGMGLLQGPAQGLLRALGQGQFLGQGIPPSSGIRPC